MGQCWPKKKRAHRSQHYQSGKSAPTSSESQQPILTNGLQPSRDGLSASEISLGRSQTEHIAVREGLDPTAHPADYGGGNALFVNVDLSQNDVRRQRRRSQYDNQNQMQGLSPLSPLKRSNSCSTIYLHETVSQPNMRNTIKAVSSAIHMLITNRQGRSYHADLNHLDHLESIMNALEIFDEKAHPLEEPVPADYATRNPECKTVYKFIRTLFNKAQLNAECAIVTLVYLERVLTYGDFELTPANWRRVTLGAIMLASKVWDDQAVWNVDFCQIFKDVSVEDMNALERNLLQILQFNTNVPSSVYAKYYFDLRANAGGNELSFGLEPISKEQALKLEAMSMQRRDKLTDHRSSLKRANSLDGANRLNRLSLAIIS